ncbi:MAG: hypothetical protein BEN19_04040 [Epulopiscium sp. Nuni2H_MBin003]|nr:MAG: hypothetical protein BEN19_04040 [Epulopiscium sp. Nuni2H_MBin003]
MKTKLGLYIHIPFCKSKCYYCDFLSFVNSDLMEKYIDALINELRSYNEYRPNYIFIGGGTPSVLPPFLLRKLLSEIEQNFGSEILEYTIEINPATLTQEHLKIINKSGINRVSIGLQSTNNMLLKEIGRIHTLQDFENTLYSLSDIENINIDLMFALPNQTIKQWEQTLLTVTKYPIKHISAYALTLEEGTKLFEKYNGKSIATAETDRQMYDLTKQILSQYNYSQYEISNWAQLGYQCNHNILYWTLQPYIGAGLGASGYLENIRYTNTTDIYQYISGKYKKEENYITTQMSMEEFMFLGLRMMSGVSKNEFKQKFGVDIKNIYGEQIKKWITLAAMIEVADRIYLSEYGVNISNTIFTSFLE